jgi:G2/mitotic-specific cyclin 3/4
MLTVGGLKAAAKRTAFADVSNTAKTMFSAQDDSALPGKSMDFVKPLALQEKSAAFLRPAQRPLNIVGAKMPLGNTSNTTISESTSTSTATNTKAPLLQGQSQPLAPLANKRTLSKRSTTIYNDNGGIEHSSQATARQESAPTAPVHQSLAPPQHKSQPQLQPDQPLLRRTQSKFTGLEPSENVIPSDPIYQDAAEDQAVDPDEAYQSYMKLMEQNKEQSAPEVSKATQNAVERLNRQLPPPPLASEPEEYWEEEEEEMYDEQGYTTAHSYRSRSENTTGGATTVLFPKVTNKAKKELAEAKNIVESSRTTEEIEDEAWDTSMVAEYGDEIFAYMRELEVSSRISKLFP